MLQQNTDNKNNNDKIIKGKSHPRVILIFHIIEDNAFLFEKKENKNE